MSKKRERERETAALHRPYLVSNEEGMVRDVRRHECPMDVCAPTTSQVREHHFPIVKSLGHNFQRHTTPPKHVDRVNPSRAGYNGKPPTLLFQ